jgi:tetratricopeptide (TPR) repeat protein
VPRSGDWSSDVCSSDLKNFAEAYVNLAQTYYVLRDNEKALGVFRKLIAKDRLNPKYFEWLGDMFSKMQKFGEASKAYKMAESLGGKSPGLFFNTGYAFFKSGRYPQAASYYQKSIYSGNDNFEVYYNLGSVCELSRSYEEALKNYQAAYDKSRDYKVLYALGNCAVMLGLYTKAIDSYRSFLEKEPLNVEALFGLANAYQIKKDFDAAISTYNKILELDRNFSKAYYNLGSIYAYHLNNPELMKKYWDQYVTLFPKNDDVDFIKKETKRLLSSR